MPNSWPRNEPKASESHQKLLDLGHAVRTAQEHWRDHGGVGISVPGDGLLRVSLLVRVPRAQPISISLNLSQVAH